MILGYSLNGATCLRLRGYHPLRRRFPAILDFTYGFSLRTSAAALVKQTPQPHTRNPCRVSHVHGLASSDFARHYSRNHFCFLFLWVLRWFTSPRCLPGPMYSVLKNAALPALGFPIRRSAGQRLFSASPRLIAAVHVLLRLLVPRHPPCALSLLTVSSRTCPRARAGMNYPFGLLVQFSSSVEAGGRSIPPTVSGN